jgi:hypothetical protein
MRRWLVAGTLGMSGCVPLYTTQVPHISFVVHDPSDRPVEGAKGTLVVVGHPYARVEGTRTFQTDSKGSARIEGESHWQIALLSIHGWKEYTWAWCIEAPGYAPAFANDVITEKNIAESTLVELQYDKASSGCHLIEHSAQRSLPFFSSEPQQGVPADRPRPAGESGR